MPNFSFRVSMWYVTKCTTYLEIDHRWTQRQWNTSVRTSRRRLPQAASPPLASLGASGSRPAAFARKSSPATRTISPCTTALNNRFIQGSGIWPVRGCWVGRVRGGRAANPTTGGLGGAHWTGGCRKRGGKRTGGPPAGYLRQTLGRAGYRNGGALLRFCVVPGAEDQVRDRWS